MIIDVPWYLGNVRVALNEPFPVEIETDTWLVDRVAAKSKGSHELRRVWIEAVRNTGPRTVFAMLGAERRPDSSAESIIRVPVLEESRRTYVSAAAPEQKAVVALARAFADAVMETAKRAIDRSHSHEVVFGAAAQTDLGSSPHLFGQVASVISTLLSQDLELQSLSEQLQDVVKREFK